MPVRAARASVNEATVARVCDGLFSSSIQDQTEMARRSTPLDGRRRAREEGAKDVA